MMFDIGKVKFGKKKNAKTFGQVKKKAYLCGDFVCSTYIG